jgi:hypothetical protein
MRVGRGVRFDPLQPQNDLEAFLVSQLDENLIEEALCFQASHCSALPVFDSIKCLADAKRTHALIFAIKDRIEKLLQEKEHIKVVEIGCGPTMVLSLVAGMIEPRRVEVEAFESFRGSQILAAGMHRFIQLQGIRNITLHQQACWARNFPQDVDLVISETLDPGLRLEPFAAIMQELSGRITGDVLPGKVKVKLNLVDLAEVRSFANQHSSDLLVLGYSRTPELSLVELGSFVYDPKYPVDQIQLSGSLNGVQAGEYVIYVSSEVECGEYSLNNYEARITAPVPFTGDVGVRVITVPNGCKIKSGFRTRLPAKPIMQ